ncbi:hypothetical protein HN011_002902 [Eciton burchellii]|nr:hypothetical protein HN011_002902 [Eciton burchellii]
MGVQVPNVQPISSISVNNSMLLTVSLARQRGRPDPVRLKSKPPLNAIFAAHALDIYRNRGGDRWSNLRFARRIGSAACLPRPAESPAAISWLKTQLELHDRCLEIITID